MSGGLPSNVTTETGSVTHVENFPALQPVKFLTSQSVTVDNFPTTQPVHVDNFPATQPVHVDNFPTPVTTVSVSNFPASTTVSNVVSVLAPNPTGRDVHMFSSGTGSLANGATRLQSFDGLYVTSDTRIRVVLYQVTAAANVLTTVAGAILSTVYVTVSDNTITPATLALDPSGHGSTLTLADPATVCVERLLCIMSAAGGLGASQAGLSTQSGVPAVEFTLTHHSTLRLNVYTVNQYSTGTGTVNINYGVGIYTEIL